MSHQATVDSGVLSADVHSINVLTVIVNESHEDFTRRFQSEFAEAVKRIYFVAETKGSMSSLELRKIEEAKVGCARKHFTKIGAELIMYDKIDSYETLLNKVLRQSEH
jgi:restriction endonuclease